MVTNGTKCLHCQVPLCCAGTTDGCCLSIRYQYRGQRGWTQAQGPALTWSWWMGQPGASSRYSHYVRLLYWYVPYFAHFACISRLGITDIKFTMQCSQVHHFHHYLVLHAPFSKDELDNNVKVQVNPLGKPSLKKNYYWHSSIRILPPPLIIDEKPLRFGGTPPLYKSEK